MIKNLKKVISTFAAVAILATSASAFAVEFPDVDASASYANAVSALTNLGIVDGDDNGKFNPENTVTRAEFTKMVVEAIGEGDSAAASTYTKFVDAQGHWGAGYIETGVAKGFINGYDDTTFGPDDKVTYAQAVKMLVAGIGYELWATEQGGYPSGYLAWGSQLDIIKGVTGVNNDTALTRAQCATLIYNTLKAPLCKIVGYVKDYQGQYYPDYQVMDGTYYNEQNQNWQSLLTEEHDAYVVKGRVDKLDKLKDEVRFQVEAAENFEGYAIKAADHDDAVPAWARVAETNADEMMFVYSEAIVQEVEGTNGEYTMISITPYGKTDIVEVAVTDIAVDSSDSPKISRTQFEVKKEGSATTKKYKLAGTNTKFYVNGEEVEDFNFGYDDEGTWTTDVDGSELDPAVNMRGTVTLISQTDAASTSSNSTYDRVMVTYYTVGEVSRIRATEDDVKINTTGVKEVIDWSLVDVDEKNVTFTKDGEVVDYTAVKEGDILLMAYDGTSADASTWVDVIVSDKTVTGMATGKSTVAGKEYLLVDGEQYKFNVAGEIADLDLNTEYTLWLDAMGYVYKTEEGTTNRNVGLVLSMLKGEHDDVPTVRLVTADGEIKSYEVKSAEVAATLADDIGGSAGEVAKLSSITWDHDENAETAEVYYPAGAKAAAANRVIEYSVGADGKLRYTDGNNMTAYTATNEEYKVSSSKIGAYSISETATKIVDLAAYLEDPTANSISKITVADLNEDTKYDAFAFDQNKNTAEYRFVILTKGTSTLTPKSSLAVVTAVNGTSQIDGENVLELVVARDGEEGITVYYDNEDAEIKEGTVVMYSVGSEGYIENTKLHVLYEPKADYDAMLSALIGSASADVNFITKAVCGTSAVAGTGTVNLNANGDNDLVVGGEADSDNETKVYYGPVYSATDSVVELFLDATASLSVLKTDKTSSSVKDFTISRANVYTFNYDANVNEGIAVSVGGERQAKSLFKNSYYAADTDELNIIWNDADTSETDGDADVFNNDVNPMTAFLRVVEDEVTDIVFYIAE